MTDSLPLTQALGAAYELHHASDRPAALDVLREAIAQPEQHQLAEAKRADLAAIVRARSVGGRCGCHISKTNHDLLAEALDA